MADIIWMAAECRHDHASCHLKDAAAERNFTTVTEKSDNTPARVKTTVQWAHNF